MIAVRGWLVCLERFLGRVNSPEEVFLAKKSYLISADITYFIEEANTHYYKWEAFFRKEEGVFNAIDLYFM